MNLLVSPDNPFSGETNEKKGKVKNECIISKTYFQVLSRNFGVG